MLTYEKSVTFNEYMQLPIGPPYQYINGCLIDWPSRTPAHQITLGNICSIFGLYEKDTENKGIFLMGPIETIFDDQNSFQPDFVYISKERRDIVKDYIYGSPDLVVEILWEKNAYYDLRQKKDIYEKYGVKEYIIVDPIAFNCELYVLINGAFQLHQKAGRTEQLNSVLLSGLSFDLNKIFNF
jgi:Uma2 family endonuclease